MTNRHPEQEWGALSRRRFLGWSGGAVAGVGLLLAGCSDDGGAGSSATSGPDGSGGSTAAPTSSEATGTTPAAEEAEGTPATTVFTAADFAALGTCVVLPDLTAGPFPTVDPMERRDISEGKEGHPLRVGVQVVDKACDPIPGVVVEIWHCDVDGDYSAYSDGFREDDAGPGTTFFRGSQVANEEGIVELLTRYPGWYTGRAVHIHAKVHIDDATVLTTQFLFDDDVNRRILADGVYAEFGEPDTTNATDGVTRGNAEADGLLMAVSDDQDIAGSRALIVVGVDPAGTSSGGGGGVPGGGGMPGGGPPRP